MRPARGRSGGRGHNRGAAGFTLLEVIVALTILAAGVAGLMAMLSGSLRLAEGTRDLSAAAIYASQRMEEALLAPDPAPGEETWLFGTWYRWTTRTSFLEAEEDSPFRPVRTQVIIRWSDGDRVREVDLAATRWTRKDRDG